MLKNLDLSGFATFWNQNPNDSNCWFTKASGHTLRKGCSNHRALQKKCVALHGWESLSLYSMQLSYKSTWDQLEKRVADLPRRLDWLAGLNQTNQPKICSTKSTSTGGVVEILCYRFGSNFRPVLGMSKNAVRKVDAIQSLASDARISD